MIKVDDLIYEFDLRLNNLGRQDNQVIPLEVKLVYLNDAQITWIKSKLNQNNIYKIGYEGMRKRIEDLQVLKVPNYKLVPTKDDNLRFPNYKVPLNPPDYMFYISSFADVTYKECAGTLNINLIKEGELDTLYFNDNYSPSFLWRQTLSTIGSNNMYVYTDNVFKINSVQMTYLRKPKQIEKKEAPKLDGSDSIDQDSELPEYAKNDILDLAVKLAAQSTDNQLQSQFAKEREISNE